MKAPLHIRFINEYFFHRQSFHSTPRTPDRRTHRCKFNTAREPQDPLTTAVSYRACPVCVPAPPGVFFPGTGNEVHFGQV